jgi:hypothetical protein
MSIRVTRKSIAELRSEIEKQLCQRYQSDFLMANIEFNVKQHDLMTIKSIFPLFLLNHNLSYSKFNGKLQWQSRSSEARRNWGHALSEWAGSEGSFLCERMTF